ncbi:PAAR motif-containing protein [Paraburkholderia unamae]|nr:PAAR motif-containing protein [Paraburkholderia unamae]
MRRRLAVVGDSLSGGGSILSYTQPLGMRARGHMVALIGGVAHCDVCNCAGVIAKAGGPRRHFYRSVREVALDGDVVRCHCATPRPIVATLAGETWFDDLAERYAVAAESPAVRGLESYDEQFTLKDGLGRLLPLTYYTLRFECGSLLHGTTDEAGRTVRHRTNGAKSIKLYIGHREE